MKEAIRIATVLVALCAGACGAAFGSASREDVADTAAKIEHCQEAGRDAGAYSAYDACMADAGLR